MEDLDDAFKALADAGRRALLDRLRREPGQSLHRLCADMDMTRQAVAKHLNILEAANLVATIWRGREKLHYLNPVPIQQIAARWIRPFEHPRLDALQKLKQSLEEKHDGKE